MHTLILATFFQLWAAHLAPCTSPAVLPTVVVVEYPYALHVHSAAVGTTTLQVIEARYIPHGGTMGYTYLVDGARVWDAPLALENMEDGTLPALPIQPASCSVEGAEGD